MPATGVRKGDFDVAFQESITRLLYQDDAFAFAAIEHLDPELFENPVHRWFVKKVRWCCQTYGHSVTPVIIQHERKKDIKLGIIRPEQKLAFKEFLARRLHKPVPDKEYIKTEVNQFVKNQCTEQLILWAAEEGLPKQDFDEIDKRMMQVVDLNITGDNTIGSFIGKTYKDRIKARRYRKVAAIGTGLPGLDSLMNYGGLEPGQLGTVLGSTGRGKSNTLINIAANNVLQGVPTVYYTCELPQDVIETRFDARFTGIPIRSLSKHEEEYEAAWANLEQQVAPNLVIKEYPMGTLTVGMIKAHLQQLAHVGFYPKLLVIDYADVMMSSITFSDSSYETQGQIYKDLKGLAMLLKLVIWTGTQSNRAGMIEDDSDVDMSKIADSAKKAFIADVVAGMNQTKKERLAGLMRIALLKNRNGPADKEVLTKVDHSICRFQERPRITTEKPKPIKPKVGPTVMHKRIQEQMKGDEQ